MSLDREQIAARLPHAGAMVLVDRVLDWDATGIRCAATSHRDPANPLRVGSRLPAWAAIEYGAQAAALHGSLVAQATHPRRGVLAALRGVRLARARLDDLAGELIVAATLVHADPAGAIYAFEARSGDAVVASGRATLMYAKASA